MAPYKYMLHKNKVDYIKSTNTNIIDLIKKNNQQEKKEKRQNVYMVAAAVSVLALSGFIISQ